MSSRTLGIIPIIIFIALHLRLRLHVGYSTVANEVLFRHKWVTMTASHDSDHMTHIHSR